MLESIRESIFVASSCLPARGPGVHVNRVVGWNKYCKTPYHEARTNFLRWHAGGRIRFDEDFENMKRSRSKFKNSLNFCRNNELKIRKEILLEKFRNGHSKKFWTQVRNLKGAAKISNCIDGENDPKKIVSIFENKFKDIFNDQSCQTPLTAVNSPDSISVSAPYKFTLSSLNDAIDNLNIDIGFDMVHSNHLKYSGPVFRNLLCKNTE